MPHKKWWTEADIETLQRRYPHEHTATLAAALGMSTNRLYRKAHKLGLKKTPEFLASPAACRLRRGDNVGAAHRFKPGQTPPNKGLRRPGYAPGRMAETQFKKGQLSPRCQRLYKPIGFEMFNTDGYLVRKVTNEKRGAQRWAHVHRLLWEEHYGPIPQGYSVKFVDGNKKNVTIGNLCLVSRQDLANINNMWNVYPRALAEVIQLRGALKRIINRRASQ